MPSVINTSANVNPCPEPKCAPPPTEADLTIFSSLTPFLIYILIL